MGWGAVKDHTSTLVGAKVYVLAGYDVARYENLSRVLVIDCSSARKKYRRSRMKIKGPVMPDVSRNGHTTCLVDDKLLMMGGWRMHHTLADVFELDLILESWRFVPTHGPVHRVLNMHVAEYVDQWQQVVCFGGGDGTLFINDTSCFDVSANRWTKMRPTGAVPGERASHCSCLVGTSYYIYGGWKQGYSYGDLHILHLSPIPGSARWSSPMAANSPHSRSGTDMVNFHGRLFIFGGYQGRAANDLQVYDPELDKWLTVNEGASKGAGDVFSASVTGTLPPNRVGLTLTAIPGNKLLMYGGAPFGSQEESFFTLEELDK